MCLTFEQILIDNIPATIVGGKGKQLSTICGSTLYSVPSGGVITAPVYSSHLRRLVEGASRQPTVDSDFVSAMRDAILMSELSSEATADIHAFVELLATNQGCAATGLRFAVRSSGVLEDGAVASFAGNNRSM